MGIVSLNPSYSFAFVFKVQSSRLILLKNPKNASTGSA
jgi:hypothetical protein